MDYLFVEETRFEEFHQIGAMFVLWPAEHAYDTDCRGGIVGDMELDVAMDPTPFEWMGKEYAKAQMSTRYEGTGPRQFWMHVHKVDSALTPLCDNLMATFQPFPDQRAVVIVLKLAEPDNGGNGGDGNGGEPEPPPAGTMVIDLEIKGTITFGE